MKRSAAAKRILVPALLALFCLLGAAGAWGTEKEEGGRGAPAEGMLRLKNYASLPGLVTMVGTDAVEHLHGFFAAAPVTIEPFIVLSGFSSRQRISLLGATLAEEMAAVIGNEASLAPARDGAAGAQEQRLSGVLQEMDGYLRIHIIAANTRGERCSYVVNVEMSEPVYRALHSYVTLQ